MSIHRFRSVFFVLVLLAGGRVWAALPSYPLAEAGLQWSRDSAASGPAVRLVQRIWEWGNEPYLSRMIVTPAYLRIDGGADWDDFILYDRVSGVVYSVAHANHTVLVVKPKTVPPQPPIPAVLRWERLSGEAEVPAHYRIFVNNSQCYDVRAVAGLLEDAVKAMAGYRVTLAGQHAEALAALPSDLMDPCDLAINIFDPTAQLRWGVPVTEWDTRGYRSDLLDYETGFVVPAALFALPADYERFSPGEP